MTIKDHLNFLRYWLIALLILGAVALVLLWPVAAWLAIAAWVNGCLVGWVMIWQQAQQATTLQHSVRVQKNVSKGLKLALPVIASMLLRLVLAPMVLVAWLLVDVRLVGVALVGCLSLNSGVVVGWLWHKIVLQHKPS